MGTIVKTYEEWGFFKKELTPDEEYQKQKKEAQKDKKKRKPVDGPNDNAEDRRAKPSSCGSSNQDDYGEEFWEDDNRKPNC